MQARGYVVREGRGLRPTSMGKLVVAFLQNHFTKYLDYDYTSDMESQLDEIAGSSARCIPSFIHSVILSFIHSLTCSVLPSFLPSPCLFSHWKLSTSSQLRMLHTDFLKYASRVRPDGKLYADRP